MRTSFSFLAIGKTAESTEALESKRYIGVGSSFVLGVNPDKKQAEEWLGHELQNDPTYINESDEVGNIRLDFYVKTDPTICKDEEGKGIEIVNRHTFFLKNQPAVVESKKNGVKYATVIDKFGNSQFTEYDKAKANAILLTKNGAAVKITPNYRIAYEGEAELVAFLKAYLGVEDAFDYKDGAWSLKAETDDYVFGLEHIKDYFKGDITEIREALALQPKNKVKLLYGIKTTDRGSFQCIATETDLVLRNSAGTKALTNLDKQLTFHKGNDSWASKFTYEVCDLKEYKVEATDLSTPAEAATDGMPWLQ